MNKTLVKDLAKKRQEYLWKKAVSKVLAVISMIVYGCFGFWALISLSDQELGKTWDHRSNTPRLLKTVSIFILSATISAIAFKFSCSSAQKAKALVRVPPVAEQIAVLPAEDILVRGSNQPAATPEELLRAAHAGKVDPAEELLRPNESIKP